MLIDGNEVNSGIAPINAEDIESVEVMTNPSLKYRVRGIKKSTQSTVEAQGSTICLG